MPVLTFVFVFQAEFRHLKRYGSLYQKQASLCSGLVECRVLVPVYCWVRKTTWEEKLQCIGIESSGILLQLLERYGHLDKAWI